MKNGRVKIGLGLVYTLICISVLLNGFPVHHLTGDKQNVPQAAAEGKKEEVSKMGSPVHTNLSGWQLRGQGRMEETEQGLRVTAEPGQQVRVLSDTESSDFIYEADVQIKDRHTDAALIFRSVEETELSYILQLSSRDSLLQLMTSRSGSDQVLSEKRVEFKEGEIYHLKVKAEGADLKVYWGTAYEPVLEVHDASFATGRLGLRTGNGSALFQNIRVSDLLGNVEVELVAEGSWQPDLKGLKGSASGDGKPALKLYENHSSNVIYEGNVILEEMSKAGLIFRMNERAEAGYEVLLTKEDGRVRVELRKSDGSILAVSEPSYPSLPTSKHHLEVRAEGQRIQVLLDGYAPAAIDVEDGTFTSGYHGLKVYAGTAYFQDVYTVDMEDYYTEKYRPQYHYSPIRGSASDPNGLVYFEGEYHLFHQDGGQWAHAVSRDLVHWKQLPIALPWNDLGHVWSGSAVADTTNASGLFGDVGGKGLIAYYTSYNLDLPGGNQKIGLAYSLDRGRTWEYSTERPVLIENPGRSDEEPGGWDFRDPKVVRDEANKRWVMVVSGGDHIRFFTSENLLDWTLTDQFGYGNYIRGGVWECPDLFQLPVEGTEEHKWVLMISTGAHPKTDGSDAEYFIGELTADGKFINDHPPGHVLKTDWGKEFYASMSFSDMPDGRRIMLAWMTNWDYPFSFPTAGWSGQLSIPREVSLRLTDEGIRMYQAPIAELASLRIPVLEAANRGITESSENILKGLGSGAYEIEAEIELPANGGASEFGFGLREGGGRRTVVGYSADAQQMFMDRSASGVTDFSDRFTTVHETRLYPENNRVRLRIFVDEGSVEAFGNDGRVVFSNVIFPEPSQRGMSFYVREGRVKIVSLKVYELASVWRACDRASSAYMIMDHKELELSKGQTTELGAVYVHGPGRGEKPMVWTSSRPDIVKIMSVNGGRAIVRAEEAGEALITAATPSGKASSSMPISVADGVFETNLSGWRPDRSSARWMVTPLGLRGSHTADTVYMADEKAGDFIYETDMRLGRQGGAGSILFRASPDGRSGYYFNLDPNMNAFRLFYKVDGRFEERQVLARMPRFLNAETEYRIKIEARGPHLRIDVNGEKVVDLMDGTFAEGSFGLHVFGGQALFQNAYVRDISDANLMETQFVNAGIDKALHAESSRNGDLVTIQDPDGSIRQRWVLVPDGKGMYSIRTKEGKALDLDTGQDRLQLYDYLGYDNQRWRLEDRGDGTVTIVSAHNDRVLEISEDGIKLQLGEPSPDQPRQSWRLTPGVDLQLME